MDTSCSHVSVGIILGFLTLICAELLAVGLGLYEEDIEGYLSKTALSHVEGSGDLIRKSKGHTFKSSKEARQTASKAWVYLKRAHMHGEGLGVIAITISLLLAHTAFVPWCKFILSLAIGLGAFLYPFSWFFAGLLMVEKGKHAAKEDLYYLAVGASGIYLTGLCAAFILFMLTLFRRRRT